jgi:MFS family permease
MQFVIGRIVTGIGNGMNTSSIPTYQAECAKHSRRGLLICIQGGSIAFGTLIAYWYVYQNTQKKKKKKEKKKKEILKSFILLG